MDLYLHSRLHLHGVHRTKNYLAAYEFFQAETKHRVCIVSKMTSDCMSDDVRLYVRWRQIVVHMTVKFTFSKDNILVFSHQL